MKGTEFNSQIESLIKILRAFKTEIAERDKVIRSQEKQIREKDALIETLQRENLKFKKVVKEETTPTKTKKQIWEELKEEWAAEFPKYAKMPVFFGNALSSWSVPFYGYDPGNEALKALIQMAKDPNNPVTAEQIYVIIYLIGEVDFQKADLRCDSENQGFLPLLSHAKQFATKFGVFRDFFSRTKIYYKPPASPSNPNPNYILDKNFPRRIRESK